MATPYYPRAGFARYLGNEAPLLDYLALIRTLKAEIEALQTVVGVIGDGLVTEAGDFLLSEAGDSLLSEA